jgi:hypothetical protein
LNPYAEDVTSLHERLYFTRINGED